MISKKKYEFDPVKMSSILETVRSFERTEILFIPMPVLDKEDFEELRKESISRLKTVCDLINHDREEERSGD